MKVINFEKAKRALMEKQSRADRKRRELEEEDRKLAAFYNKWYDDHVVGQGPNGEWLYKDL